MSKTTEHMSPSAFKHFKLSNYYLKKLKILIFDALITQTFIKSLTFPYVKLWIPHTIFIHPQITNLIILETSYPNQTHCTIMKV